MSGGFFRIFTGKKRLPLVVLVELKRLTIYSALIPEPLVLEYPEGAVEDMEFTDTRFIESQILVWKNEEKIAESNTYLLFAEDCYFRKDFPKMPPAEDPQVISFLSMVPFQHKLSKTFQLEQGATAVSLSTNVYRPIVQVLDSLHCTVTLAMPLFAINPEILKQGKPVEIISKLGSMFDQLKLLSFISEDEREKKMKANQKIQTGLPADKKQLILLVGMFVVLLGLLGLVYRWSVTSDELPAQPAPSIVPSIAPTAEPTPVATESAAVTAPDPTEVAATTIQVLNGSGIPGQADQVRQALLDAGFATVVTGNNTGGTVSRASIVFDASVSEPVRKLLVDSVGTVVTQAPIIEQANEATEFDVRIVTSP